MNGAVHNQWKDSQQRDKLETWSQMHENPVTEAKIIAGPLVTTLRNRETTVMKDGNTGTSKTWYGTRRAVRKMSHCSTQAPHEPSHAVTTSSRQLMGSTHESFHQRPWCNFTRLVVCCRCGDVGIVVFTLDRRWCTSWTLGWLMYTRWPRIRDWRSSEHNNCTDLRTNYSPNFLPL